MPKHRNIRSLTSSCDQEIKKTFFNKKLILIIVLLFISYNLYFNEEYKKELQHNLNTFVYKSDYCLNENYDNVFKKVRNEILNQDLAITEIEKEFQNYAKKFKSMVILGGSGVGKTALTNILLDEFPWKENIQSYIWTTYAPVESKYKKINEFVNKICDCGTNLIIIDDLSLDINLKDFALKTEEYLIQKQIPRLILIFIYNIRNGDNENFKEIVNQFKANHLQKNTKLITFRNFIENDLESCIRKEEKNLNISLNHDELNELKKSIDVSRSGCKKVHSKMNLYKKL